MRRRVLLRWWLYWPLCLLIGHRWSELLTVGAYPNRIFFRFCRRCHKNKEVSRTGSAKLWLISELRQAREDIGMSKAGKVIKGDSTVLLKCLKCGYEKFVARDSYFSKCLGCGSDHIVIFWNW